MDEHLLSQLNSAMEKAPQDVQSIILDGVLDTELASLTVIYHLSVDEAIITKNIVLLTLLGLLPVNDIDQALAKDLSISEEDRGRLVKDIDDGIFERVRTSLFGKEYEKEEGAQIRQITVGKEENKNVLRQQILAHIEKGPTSTVDATLTPITPAQKQSPVQPGSRDELLERMSILDTIPKNEEIESRLAKIRAQVAMIEKEKAEQEETVEEKPPTTIVSSLPQVKAKVVFPSHYDIDPYREEPVR